MSRGKILKRKSFIVYFIGIIFSLLSVFITSTMTKDSLISSAQNNENLSIYNETKYDYIINNASLNQIEEYKKSEYVEEVTSVYYLEMVQTINEKRYTNNVLFIEDFSQKENTEYTKQRELFSTKVNDNCAFIDYSFAVNNNINLKDQILFKVNGNEYKVIVSSIYRDNINMSNGSIMIPLFDSLKNDLISQYLKANIEFKPNKTYVSTNNADKFFEDYLKEFKPMGIFLEKDEFSDDKAYEEYVTSFNSKDYTDYIIIKNTNYNTVIENSNMLEENISTNNIKIMIINMSIMFLGTLFSFLIFISSIKQDLINGDRKNIQKRYLISTIMNIFIFILCFILLNSMVEIDYYYSFKDVLSNQFRTLIFGSLGSILSLVIIEVIILSNYGLSKK